MSLTRIGVLTGLDLRQRARRAAFYILLTIFFVVVTAITVLAYIAGGRGSGSLTFSIGIYGVLLMATLVTPTFTGNAVNGDRDAATLAPVQVTLATTGEILVSKLLSGWAIGLVYLLAALPALIFAVVMSLAEPEPYALFGGEHDPIGIDVLAISILVLIVQVGIIAAIGVGLSAIIARPLFSVAATYLIVMLLTLGTLIAFALGSYAIRSDTVTLTESPGSFTDFDSGGSALPLCADAPAGAACVTPRPDVTEGCYAVENLSWSSAMRSDRVWWMLAMNPYIVLADATPTTYTDHGSPVDMFGFIKVSVRMAQMPPDLETSDWSDPCDGREPPAEGSAWYSEDYPTDKEIVEQTVPSWFVGLGIQVLIAAALMLWGAGRTQTPAKKTPPGSRIA
ncbi:ABC transporter permease [Microbacterium amylolyticum]|uniref:ABC transporter permease n=1 Tax=Microbacterium amylolyticum TaxID=936337 RepID=A0ABS4ZI08_9MICO|nr:ABC transporter permease [Microbacterium amylolyticum]MBP2436911.1 hypothetical protein [Microbacterium amylolyticum]